MIDITKLDIGDRVVMNRDFIEEGQPPIPKGTQLTVVKKTVNTLSTLMVKHPDAGMVIFIDKVFDGLDKVTMGK